MATATPSVKAAVALALVEGDDQQDAAAPGRRAQEPMVQALQEAVGLADRAAVHAVGQVGGDHGEAWQLAAGQVGVELAQRHDPPAAPGVGADAVQVQERVDLLGVGAGPGRGGAGGGPW